MKKVVAQRFTVLAFVLFAFVATAQAQLVQPSTYATGEVIFFDNPVDGDTLTLNGLTFTFKNSPTSCYHIGISVNAGATRANALARFQDSQDPRLTVASYHSEDLDVINITYKAPGCQGNSYTLQTSSAGRIQFGGGANTLTGGGPCN